MLFKTFTTERCGNERLPLDRARPQAMPWCGQECMRGYGSMSTGNRRWGLGNSGITEDALMRDALRSAWALHRGRLRVDAARVIAVFFVLLTIAPARGQTGDQPTATVAPRSRVTAPRDLS